MRTLDWGKAVVALAMVCGTVLVVSGKLPPQSGLILGGALVAYLVGLFQQSPIAKPTASTMIAGHDVNVSAPDSIPTNPELTKVITP